MKFFVWVKHAFRDYYKPKLRRDLNREPTQVELDARFEDIYSRISLTLLVGVTQGVGIAFPEIARFTREEFETFRAEPEAYLFERFGGGYFKLNFYEGSTYVATVNFKPKGEPKWRHLIS